MKRLALLMVVLAGCAAPAATPSPTPAARTIAGTFTLAQKDRVVRYSNAVECNGTGGYDDIKPGVGVTVKDDKGAIVGLGALASVPVPSADPPYVNERRCVYSFSIDGVADAPFYSVEVGHRGAVTYSRADLAAVGWTLALTLGE